jgi:histidyl-tRNA synthetase
MIRKIKGTMDIFPEDAALFQYIEGVMREQAQSFGFGEIRTPTFENTELFVRGVGDTTDVVQKEMYTFADRDENRSISLRPEGTASVVRALIENGKCSEAMPLKYYYIISCFRHEKPQAGRSREFFQFGTEMFGTDSPYADATAIALAHSVFRRLGLTNVKLHINSIGCPECRPTYRQSLVDYYSQHKECICDTCKERLVKNPLRLIDCKNPDCAALAKEAPRTIDAFCESCATNFEKLKGALATATYKEIFVDPTDEVETSVATKANNEDDEDSCDNCHVLDDEPSRHRIRIFTKRNKMMDALAKRFGLPVPPEKKTVICGCPYNCDECPKKKTKATK